MQDKSVFGNTVILDGHDTETSRYKENTLVRVADVGKNLTDPHCIAELIGNMVNGGGCGRARGRETGKALHLTHRAIQRIAVDFLIGILEGLSENEDVDVRNRAAIATTQKLVQSLGNY